MEKRNQAAKLIIGAVIVIIAILALAGIVSQHHITYKSAPLSREDIDYEQLKSVKAPAATSKDGVISAKDWAKVSDVYRHIAESMLATTEYQDSNAEDYLETDPYLKTLYAEYGFHYDYKEARGHVYTMEDVMTTERTHLHEKYGKKPQNANCLTCKTPNFTVKTETDIGIYSEDFQTVHAEIAGYAEGVSCYNCHGNTPNEWHRIDPENEQSAETNLTVTHPYVTKALGDSVRTIDPGVLACGQCHIEYYFDPTTGETMMPYHSVEEMSPEAIYAYYQDLGFKDWEHADTGAQMLKVQHPEMETYLTGVHAGELTCADCHMPIVQDAKDRSIYHSHMLVSPLNDETLLASCARCHGDTDMVAKVEAIRTRIRNAEKRVGKKLETFTNLLAAAIRENRLSESDLETLRGIQREAQWYFDFCYVENSEGAHNSDLSMHCLEKAEELIDAGMQLLEPSAE